MNVFKRLIMKQLAVAYHVEDLTFSKMMVMKI